MEIEAINVATQKRIPVVKPTFVAPDQIHHHYRCRIDNRIQIGDAKHVLGTGVIRQLQGKEREHVNHVLGWHG